MSKLGEYNLVIESGSEPLLTVDTQDRVIINTHVLMDFVRKGRAQDAERIQTESKNQWDQIKALQDDIRRLNEVRVDLEARLQRALEPVITPGLQAPSPPEGGWGSCEIDPWDENPECGVIEIAPGGPFQLAEPGTELIENPTPAQLEPVWSDQPTEPLYAPFDALMSEWDKYIRQQLRDQLNGRIDRVIE